MPRGPVRRGQLISPFGPGAMMILPDGVSVICGGLDHWFKHESGDAENIDQREYQVDEWRLAARLNVGHFFLPPDHRRVRRHDPPTNGYLTVPFLRFPQWHYCTRCGLMRRVPLVTKGRIKCAGMRSPWMDPIYRPGSIRGDVRRRPHPGFSVDRMGVRHRKSPPKPASNEAPFDRRYDAGWPEGQGRWGAGTNPCRDHQCQSRRHGYGAEPHTG